MPKEKEEKFVTESTVARFLTDAINRSSKSQMQIAAECGFTSTNMVTMVKQGRSKMPIQKVKLMADSLGVDARLLMKMCFEEYQPGAWEVIEEVFRSSPITNPGRRVSEDKV